MHDAVEIDLPHQMTPLNFNCFICLLPCLAFPWSIAQGEAAQTLTTKGSMFMLPNGAGVQLMNVLEPLPEAESLRLHVKNIWYERIILRSNDGSEKIIYQSPSSPYEQSVGQPQDISALMNDQKAEVFRSKNGHFSLMRLERIAEGWRFVGEVTLGDLSSFQFAPDSAEKVELVDWSAVRLMIRDGSVKTLTIDPDGVVRENGVVHVLKHQSRTEGMTDEEFYKIAYKASQTEYYLPRDASGMSLGLVEHLLKTQQQAIAQAQNADTLANVTPVQQATARIADKSDIGPQSAPVINKKSVPGQLMLLHAWLAWGAVSVAAAGLLWLVLKKRRN